MSIRQAARSDRKPRNAPPVFVSAYEPLGRRRWWWYSYRCPHPNCGTYQLGRAASLDKVTGERRAGCGHRITVAIARTYMQPRPETAA
jgi:hypothetical protein